VSDKPNIILLAVDCLRSDRALGAGRSGRTPNIDALAARGASLPNVFVENSITPPAFASLLTGRYAARHGVRGMVGQRLASSATTMAEVLAGNGYHTYAEATGPLHPILGLDRGFERYDYRLQSRYYFTPWGDQLLSRFKNREFTPPYFVLVHFWEAHVPVQVRPEYDSAAFGAAPYDRALSGLDAYLGRLLETVGEDNLVILTGDHGECLGERPPPRTLLPYFLNKLGLPPAGPDPMRSIDDVTELVARQPLLHHFTEEIAGALRRGEARISLGRRWPLLGKMLRIGWTRYSIQSRNGRFLKIFANLEQKITDTRLLLAVLGGRTSTAQRLLIRNSLREHVLQHGYHIYDYLQRVPVIMAKRGLFRPGARFEAEMRQVDLLPTLIDALALNPGPGSFDGLSFFPELSRGRGENRPAFLEARGGAQADDMFLIRGVRRDRKKVAFAPFEPGAPLEFYDLKDDPAETANLAGREGGAAAALREEAEAIASALSDGDGGRLSPRENLEIIDRLRSLGYL